MRIVNLVLGILIGAVLFTTASVIIAWTGPTSAPPNGNVSAPLNTSSVDQIKDAGLGLNAIAVFGNAIISGASRYLNFGDSAGESGYGIRDNAGTMEFKDSGASWSSLTSVIQSFFSSGNSVSQIKFEDGTTQTTAAAAVSSCPSGWTMIGTAGAAGTYCIETNERPSATFWNAAYACGGVQPTGFGRAHLCNYSQWYTACRYGSGLLNMTNSNQEWLDDVSNTSGGSALTVGRSSCDFIDGEYYDDSNSYRCCLL